MCSRRVAQTGFTMIEMIVTIVLFSAMAAVGSLLISKLAPSYLVGVQAEQALSPREAALWRLSEDFRKSLMDGTYPFQTGCTLNLAVVSGMNGATPITQVVSYTWSPDSLWMSSPTASGVLLDKVTLNGNTCPVSYASCDGRICLQVAFRNTAGVNETVALPVSTTLYSYVNGPYVSAISPVSGLNISPATVSMVGIYPGVPGVWTRIDFISGTSVFSLATDTGLSTSAVLYTSTVIPNLNTLSGVVDVKVTTPEGWSLLKQAFTFVSQ